MSKAITPEDLRDMALHVLEEMQGVDVASFDIRTLTSIADYMIICSGRSTRQVKAMADEVMIEAKKRRAQYVHCEGEQESEWILVDLGDVIVHLMLPATREFYSLEDLWGSAKAAREQSGQG